LGVFGKTYKLCSRKTIDLLFKEGKQVRSFPFVVYWKEATLTEAIPFQLVFSAPKRSFRRAHDRNKIKRLLRETFRNKKENLELILQEQQKQVALFVIYAHKEELPFAELLVHTEKLITKLSTEIKNNSNNATN
jgi:ribonuclease P protein component